MLSETFVAWLVGDAEFFRVIAPPLSAYVKTYDIFADDKILKFVVSSAIRHYAKYGSQPSFDVLDNEAENASGVDSRDVWGFLEAVRAQQIKEADREWAITTAEKWLKKLIIISAVEKASTIIVEDGTSGERIVGLVEKAAAFSVGDSSGHDLVSEWQSRLEYYKRKEEKIEFFLPWLTKTTGGGMRNRTLNVVTTRTGGGKTMFMVNQAVHSAQCGLNVLYVTMEDGEMEIAQRMDAIMVGVPLHELSSKSINEGMFASKASKVYGNFSGGMVSILELPAGTSSTLDIRAHIDDIKGTEGWEPDIIFVDYLNLLSSISSSRRDGMYTYIGSIAIELRELAKKLGVPVVTASQLNRDGARQDDPTTEDLSESMVVSHTADFMLGIIADKTMRENRQAVLKIMKSRYGGEGMTTMVVSDPHRGVIEEMGRKVRTIGDNCRTGQKVVKSSKVRDMIRNKVKG